MLLVIACAAVATGVLVLVLRDGAVDRGMPVSTHGAATLSGDARASRVLENPAAPDDDPGEERATTRAIAAEPSRSPKPPEPTAAPGPGVAIVRVVRPDGSPLVGVRVALPGGASEGRTDHRGEATFGDAPPPAVPAPLLAGASITVDVPSGHVALGRPQIPAQTGRDARLVAQVVVVPTAVLEVRCPGVRGGTPVVLATDGARVATYLAPSVRAHSAAVPIHVSFRGTVQDGVVRFDAAPCLVPLAVKVERSPNEPAYTHVDDDDVLVRPVVDHGTPLVLVTGRHRTVTLAVGGVEIVARIHRRGDPDSSATHVHAAYTRRAGDRISVSGPADDTGTWRHGIDDIQPGSVITLLADQGLSAGGVPLRAGHATLLHDRPLPARYDVDIELAPAGAIRGRLVHSDGRPPTGWSVRVRPSDGFSSGAAGPPGPVTVDVSGRFEFASLVAPHYDVIAERALGALDAARASAAAPVVLSGATPGGIVVTPRVSTGTEDLVVTLDELVPEPVDVVCRFAGGRLAVASVHVIAIDGEDGRRPPWQEALGTALWVSDPGTAHRGGVAPVRASAVAASDDGVVRVVVATTPGRYRLLVRGRAFHRGAEWGDFTAPLLTAPLTLPSATPLEVTLQPLAIATISSADVEPVFVFVLDQDGAPAPRVVRPGNVMLFEPLRVEPGQSVDVMGPLVDGSVLLHVQVTPEYAPGAGARHAVDPGRPRVVSAGR